MLPFCHTVEAEAMGGIVNMGDGNLGPRAKEYCCTSAAELLELRKLIVQKGRIFMRCLKRVRDFGNRERACGIDDLGPFTIFNVLIDPKYVFKAMRKQPELMRDIFKR